MVWYVKKLTQQAFCRKTLYHVEAFCTQAESIKKEVKASDLCMREFCVRCCVARPFMRWNPGIGKVGDGPTAICRHRELSILHQL